MRKVVETIYCDLCQLPIKEFKLINVPQLTKDNQIDIVEKEICYNCCNKIINFLNNFNNISSVQSKPLKQEINNSNKENNISNKNLILENIDIEIPHLNKLPNAPLSDKYPDTKIFLGGIGHAKERAINRKFKIPYILDSIMDFPLKPSKLVKQYFDYIKKNNIEYLLDSGAYTYMYNTKKSFNLKDHLQKYCYYINEFDIQNFFELDLDVFLSIDEIENIRKKIFLETHKKPIIVYHDERGYNYWINMCKENDFIAIGGIAGGKVNWNSQEGIKILKDMCDEAHAYNTLVHGLGYTPLSLLNTHTMFFDTVDSTTWNGTKTGISYIINEKNELIKTSLKEYFFSTDAQENDLQAWAQFSAEYKGALIGRDKYGS